MRQYNQYVVKNKLRYFLILQFALLMYGFIGVLGKVASLQGFLSFKYCLFLFCILAILMAYTVLWQVLLSKFSLLLLFSFKSVIVIYGVLWGYVFFDESIYFTKLIGVALVVMGIVIIGTIEHE